MVVDFPDVLHIKGCSLFLMTTFIFFYYFTVLRLHFKKLHTAGNKQIKNNKVLLTLNILNPTVSCWHTNKFNFMDREANKRRIIDIHYLTSMFINLTHR